LKLKLSRGVDKKLNISINLSKNRLAEFESAIAKGDANNAQKVLNDSEKNLKEAVVASQSKSTSDEDLLKIKQANDLNIKTLSEIAEKLSDDKKEDFVNIVYKFFSDNGREVKPIINKSLSSTRSTSQQPLIGTVSAIKNKVATIKFDDGLTKEVIVNDAVVTREFNSLTADTKGAVNVGSKVAIVGNIAKDGKIVPQFILRNVPKNLPDKNNGTVIEIDSQKSSLKIMTTNGSEQNVKVDDKTQIKSKDTNVSLEGIKAGSQVTVFGTQASGQQSRAPKTTSDSTNIINAKTITVTKNDSGTKESKKFQETKPSDSKKSDSKPGPTTPPQSSAPQTSPKPEEKKPEKKP